MSKNLTTGETLALAEKSEEHGIVPEFSFVFGDPDDPVGDADKTLAFIGKIEGDQSGDEADHLLLHADAPAARERTETSTLSPGRRRRSRSGSRRNGSDG